MRSDTTSDRPDPEFFAQELARVPRHYSPLGHLTATVGIGLTAWIAGCLMVESFGWSEAAWYVGMGLFANLVEWGAHKELLHKRRRPFQKLYDQHVPRHHVFYREDAMAVRSRKEWYFVLMPAVGVLAIALLAVPLAVAVGLLVDPDAGWVILMVAGSYASVYEVMHLCFHLPDHHWVKRLPFVGRAILWLALHHARHHNWKRMRKKNLNVLPPLLGDLLFGTMAPWTKRGLEREKLDEA